MCHPERAKEPQIAYNIMSYGMRKGSFTGKKLSDYIHGDVCDYKNARRIISKLDRWELGSVYISQRNQTSALTKLKNPK